MGKYVPSTSEEQQEMLKAVGVSSFDELYTVVPSGMKVDRLAIPEGKSELEVSGIVRAMAAKNKVYSSIFRGAGAYNHYIPSIVKSITGKEEFLKAYTPYQAEISQGILQSIFEYQTMICELPDMDVSNASVYDGASAAAEAMAMCHNRKKKKTVISGAVNPMTIQTIQTYCEGNNTEAVVVPAKDGKTDLKALMEAMDQTTSGVFIQQPRDFGQIEDAAAIGEAVHAAGAKFVMGIYPIAGAALKSPRECGADVVTGEGQPLGMSLAFGGPYLGFMACTHDMMRQLPGRIVGETKDVDGRRAYVLTLQAREQHIRREKASSNICSNQALCAMTAAVYMASMGTTGVSQVASLCYSKAHYAAAEISRIPGFELVNQGDFFNEFVTKIPCDADMLLKKLSDHDILGGYPVEGGILWCVTEMNSKAQIDALADCLKEVRA